MSRVQVRPSAKMRQRRRRRRTITLLAYTAIVFGLAWYFDSMGTTTVIFVRHADVDQPALLEDQPLNEAGRVRAELLADYLDLIDVVQSVDAIYVSPLKQTHQTAAPLAERHGLEPVVADPYDVVRFTRNVLSDHKRKIVLVVTHADAIAPLVEELHGSKNLAEIGPNDYSNIYIVTIPTYGKVKTLQLPYVNGAPELLSHP